MKKHGIVLGLVLLSVSVLFAQGGKEQAASTSGPEKVIIATEGAYAPFNYINEKGEVDGYDVAIAKAVDELVPELESQFQPVEWSSIFVGMESGRYDIIISEVSKNPAREEKYLFGDVPYEWGVSSIISKKGKPAYTSLDDLVGKKVDAGTGSYNTSVLEKYNAEHDGKINIVYTDGDVTKMLLDIVNERVDATVNSPVTTKLIADQQGLDVQWTLRSDATISPVFFLYNKNAKGARYKSLIEPALKQVIESGKAAEISKKYLGDDYSTKEAVEARLGK